MFDLLSALFGLLFSALCDPGGGFRQRASHISLFALIGAGVTALAFGIGADARGWLVLAAFVVTLVAGLAITLGVRRFVDALLLNIWFIAAIALTSNLHQHARVAAARTQGSRSRKSRATPRERSRPGRPSSSP